MAKILINISQKQAYLYAGFLVLYEFLTYIANDMIMPGMLSVVKSFHGPESAIATSLTLYLLGGATLQLFLGPISDRYGRRPIMIFGALLFFICTVFIALTFSMEQFLAARYFQGMGLCFIAVIGYATLQEIFSEMDAIRLIAIMANVSIIAPLIGPLLGALFIYYYSWRMIFAVIGVLALVALWGLYKYMPESIGQIKTDGKEIKCIPLSPKITAVNYKNLLLNRSFMFASVALGIMYIPCLAWIALSPIMLVEEAHLSVMEYALWQLPVFGAYILGNIFLHHMTHKRTVKKMIGVGSAIASVGFILCYVVPHSFGGHFLWLMPGLIVYFFSGGIVGAPLSRFILFSTPISKGTASALMGMLSIIIPAIGIEFAKSVYSTHNNIFFGSYCALVGFVYFIALAASFWKSDAMEAISVEK